MDLIDPNAKSRCPVYRVHVVNVAVAADLDLAADVCAVNDKPFAKRGDTLDEESVEKTVPGAISSSRGRSARTAQSLRKNAANLAFGCTCTSVRSG